MADLEVNITVSGAGVVSSDVDPIDREIMGLPVPIAFMNQLRAALGNQVAGYKEILIKITVEAPE